MQRALSTLRSSVLILAAMLCAGYGVFHGSAAIIAAAAGASAGFLIVRRAATPTQVIMILAGALASALGSEIVHTFASRADAGAPGGPDFRQAMIDGSAVAFLFVLVLLLLSVATRIGRRRGSGQ